MRAKPIQGKRLEKLLRFLGNPDALVLRVSQETGLRVDDVLELHTHTVRNFAKFDVKEKKTGKTKAVSLTRELRHALLSQAGYYFVFQSKRRVDKHRHRSTVFRNVKIACLKAGIDQNHVSPHSMRKNYAVDAYKRCGSVEAVQQLLNHKNIAVTLGYVFADKL